MAKAVTDTVHYAAIADAIRAKNGDTAALYTPAQMAPAIHALSGGGGPDLSADTVTPETLLYGRTAHDAAGNPITGTLGADAVPSVPGFTVDSVTNPVCGITSFDHLVISTDFSAIGSNWTLYGGDDALSFSTDGMKLLKKGSEHITEGIGERYNAGVIIPTPYLTQARSFTMVISTIIHYSRGQDGEITIFTRTGSGGRGEYHDALVRAAYASRPDYGYAATIRADDWTHGTNGNTRAVNDAAVPGIITLSYDGTTLSWRYTDGTYDHSWSAVEQPGSITQIDVRMCADPGSRPVPDDMRVTGLSLDMTF